MVLGIAPERIAILNVIQNLVIRTVYVSNHIELPALSSPRTIGRQWRVTSDEVTKSLMTSRRGRIQTALRGVKYVCDQKAHAMSQDNKISQGSIKYIFLFDI